MEKAPTSVETTDAERSFKFLVFAKDDCFDREWSVSILFAK